MRKFISGIFIGFKDDRRGAHPILNQYLELNRSGFYPTAPPSAVTEAAAVALDRVWFAYRGVGPWFGASPCAPGPAG